MAILRTIRIVRTIFRLAYRLSRLSKKLESDIKKAKRGKLKEKDIIKTTAQIVVLVREFHQILERFKKQVEETSGVELKEIKKYYRGGRKALKTGKKIYNRFN